MAQNKTDVKKKSSRNRKSKKVKITKSISAFHPQFIIDKEFEEFSLLPTTNPLAAIITPDPPHMSRIPIDYPAMPSTVIIAQPFTFTAYIEYADHGRDDVCPTITGTASSRPWYIDFGNEIQGGELHYDCTIVFEYVPTGQTQISVYHATKGSIRGQNPSKEEVRARLGDIRLQVIAYKESRFLQFDNDGGVNIGSPTFGAPNGFGIMQLDTPAPDRVQLWDWTQNVDAGKALFAQKQAEVIQHFKNLRTTYPHAPKLTDEMLKLAIYQYYNGGFYWSWDNVGKKWIKVDTTGYADDCLSIEKLVTAGNPPSDWN